MNDIDIHQLNLDSFQIKSFGMKFHLKNELFFILK
jgi:hypothetical protein